MRINKYIALATGMSRRQTDQAITDKLVNVNGLCAELGQIIRENDIVLLNGKKLRLPQHKLILLNKPVGYVCSRNGQGNKTIYDLLPEYYNNLKPVGRLDKDSSGLLILTNNGNLAHQLTHPSFKKTKIYKIELDIPLKNNDKNTIEHGIQLSDGLSKLELSGNNTKWQITMSEGRNRQIRRTFKKLGYNVTNLHRTHFGKYTLSNLQSGAYTKVK